MTLTGERISLRELTVDDASDAFAWGGDAEWFQYLPVEPVATVEDETAFLVAREIEAHEQPRAQYHLGVVWNGTGELIGSVRLGISSPSHRGGDMGYGVRRDLWGRGITTEAAGLLLDFGFGALGLHRIFAVHHPDNVGSGRVMQKLGMRFEGRQRDHMYSHGTWRDSLAYAILEDEWQPGGRAVAKTYAEPMRALDLQRDRDLVLDLHVLASYESETPISRVLRLDEWRTKWLATEQPGQFLDTLRDVLADPRAFAAVWEEDGRAVAYAFARITEAPGFATIAELGDIAILPEYQRLGIGLALLRAIEVHAVEHGADILRSAAGIENVASQRLHERAGWQRYEIGYEKDLHRGDG